MAVFRVEKTRDYTIIAKHHLKNKKLSLKAKGLLTLMLSLPEEWDYSLKGLAALGVEGVDSVRSTVNELEEHGYVERHRVRNSKGQLTDTEYIIREYPITKDMQAEALADNDDEKKDTKNKPIHNGGKLKTFKNVDKAVDNCVDKSEKGVFFAPPTLGEPILENPTLDNPKEENPISENPIQSITKELSIKELKTDVLITQSINPQNKCLGDCRTATDSKKDDTIDTDRDIEKINAYHELIKENIDYDVLCDQYSKASIDGIVEIMLETVCSTKPKIRVKGEELPSALVQSTLLKLDMNHIEYVMDCINKNTTKVHNIKQYLLTSLWNANKTIDHYYRTEVNHDMYGRKNE